MIRITVELLPWGFEDGKKVLGTAEIWNTGEGTAQRGDYEYRLFGQRKKLMRSGQLKSWPRKAYHVWFMLRRILEDAL